MTWQLASSYWNQYCRPVAKFLIAGHRVLLIVCPNTHYYSRNHRTTPLEDNTRRQCPHKLWFFRCAICCISPFYVGVLMLSIGHFANLEVILTHTISRRSTSLFQTTTLETSTKLHATLASSLTGEKTWALCGSKAFHFQFFPRTFHTIPILSSNLLERSRMRLLSLSVKFFILSTVSREKEVSRTVSLQSRHHSSDHLCMWHFPGFLGAKIISDRRHFGLQMGSFLRWKVL